MSFECMAWAIKQQTGSASNKAVLMHLANCTNHQTGMCRPRIKEIACEWEISESTVKRALIVLADRGLITIIPRFKEGVQLANDYRLNLEGVGSQGTQGGFTLNPGVGSQGHPVETGSIETGIEPVLAFDVVEVWNMATLGTNLPKARMTPQRANIVKARLKVKGWTEDFRAACKHVANSRWHRGENDTQWVANIDFLLQAGKATQLAERATATPAAKADKWNGIGDKDYSEGTEGLRPVEGAGDVAKYL